MINVRMLLITIVSLAVIITACSPEQKASAITAGNAFPVLEGPYLGQKLPGSTPEIFSPGVVSTTAMESSCSFSPDGKTFVFGHGGDKWVLVYLEMINGIWQEPKLAPFSGEQPDFDLNFDPVANKLYFSSVRADPQGKVPAIFVVDRLVTGWSTPKHIGMPFDATVDYHHPSAARNGNLYFYSKQEGNFGEGDLYFSRLVDGVYQEPENLGVAINTEGWEGDIAISPDEEYLIFAAERPGGFGEADLYISFRTGENQWTEAENMGPGINTAAAESCPNISCDGKVLLFFSARTYSKPYPDIELSYQKELGLELSKDSRAGDIYWVSTSVVEKLHDLVNFRLLTAPQEPVASKIADAE